VIYYSPIDGDARQQPVAWRHRTAFIMQQMGDPVPASVTRARRAIDKALKKGGFATIDAGGIVSGKDFLSKIWNLILGCPVGIAIVHEHVSRNTGQHLLRTRAAPGVWSGNPRSNPGKAGASIGHGAH